MSLEEKIESLGLTKSEAKIYLSLIQEGVSTASKISISTKINRRNVYDAISTLIDKGLIFFIVSENEKQYAAVSPEKLIEHVASKEILLNKIIPDLQKLYGREFKKETVFIYKGVEGFKRFLEDIIRVGKDVYCLGAKGGWGFEGLGETRTWFERERARKGIKVHNLFDYEMKEIISSKNPAYSLQGDYRFLPKEYSSSSAVDVFGDYTVTFSGLQKEKIDDDLTLFVIVSESIAETNRTWFKFIWDECGKM